jgi:chemotaxis protein methyltransferase CheR
MALLKDLVLRVSGNRVPSGMEHILSWRLNQVAWRRNLLGPAELFEQLRAGGDEALEQDVVEQFLDTDTWFFRDEATFFGIHSKVLPDLMHSRAATKFVKILVPGAGTGQEVYSLILSIRHHFPAMVSWDLRVLGTDISEASLERARKAAYTDAEVRRGLPLALLVRNFIRIDDHWVLKGPMRKQAAFRKGNLAEGFGPDIPAFDIVCVRNLLQSIEPALRPTTIANAAGQVAPGGFLVLGNSEMNSGLVPDPKVFRPLGGGIFKSFEQVW